MRFALSQSIHLTTLVDHAPLDGAESGEPCIAAERTTRAPLRPAVPAFASIAFLLILRLALLPFMVLIPEESYYWMYSKYPALGYLDHPPMVAWLIRVGTGVFGQCEFGVRIAFWLLGVGSTWLAYRFTADWSGRLAGLAVAVLFSIAPLYCFTGFFATPDAPLLFFWLLALLGLTRAWRSDRLRWWLLSGCAVGLGFLAKYPAAVLVPGAWLFLVSDARGRRALARPGPWLALLVAFLAASPVVWWNATHDWASFRFQFVRRVDEHSSLNLRTSAEWIGTQIGFLSPLVFALFALALVVAVRRLRRDRTGHARFALCFAAPWLAVCAWHGLFTRIHINWPLPAYLALLPLAGTLTRVPWLPGLSRLTALGRHTLRVRYAAAMLGIEAVVLVYAALPLRFAPRPYAVIPWNKLGAAAELAEDEFEKATTADPFIIADGKYNLACELAFYMRDEQNNNDWQDVVPARTIFGGGLSFAAWRHESTFLGRNAIYVSSDPRPPKLEMLRLVFSSIGAPRRFFSDARLFGERREYWIARCYDYHGLPGRLARPRSG